MAITAKLARAQCGIGNSGGAARRKALAADVISSLMRRLEEERDARYANMDFSLPASFLVWIFTILPDRDPASEVLQEVARRCRLDWQDILILSQIFRGSGQAKNVLECVSRLYGEEFWNCVNAASYDLAYTLCELHRVREHGNEALVALLSDLRTDLYRIIDLNYSSKPLLHLLIDRCSAGMLRASLEYEQDEEALQRYHAQYREILRTIVTRDDFDPDAEDGGNPCLTSAEVLIAAGLRL